MKSTNFFLPLLTAIALINFSCEKTDVEESVITYLPNIQVIGSTNVQLACDATSYTDPGVNATEGGQPVSVNTSLSGLYFGSSTIDGPDLYVINYSATNQDGIPGAAMRTVLWPECNGDLVTSIAGMYKATVVRDGIVLPQYMDLFPFFIRDMGNNVYQLSDAVGSYYDYGRGFGPQYAALGMQVTANNIPANDFTHDQTVTVGLFGGNLIMTNFSVDPATRTITFTTVWDIIAPTYVFDVTLTQVDL